MNSDSFTAHSSCSYYFGITQLDAWAFRIGADQMLFALQPFLYLQKFGVDYFCLHLDLFGLDYLLG